MATNVSAQDLNYDCYETVRYDREISLVIPGWQELHTRIEEFMQKRISRPTTILELGIGTGLTAERILRFTPHARYRAFDFSKQMIQGARERLSRYPVEYILGDYALIDLPSNNDLVVSVIGIHHQQGDDAKRALFRRILKSLRPGGAFLFGDLVTYRDRYQAALGDALHFHHLVEHAPNEDSLREWAHHHCFLNDLEPLEDQIEWLREVGFRSVELKFQRFNTTLLYARR